MAGGVDDVGVVTGGVDDVGVVSGGVDDVGLVAGASEVLGGRGHVGAGPAVKIDVTGQPAGGHF